MEADSVSGHLGHVESDVASSQDLDFAATEVLAGNFKKWKQPPRASTLVANNKYSMCILNYFHDNCHCHKIVLRVQSFVLEAHT